jgi:hypothetical protein
VPAEGPNFSPFPTEQLRRLTRADAALETALARWLAARPLGTRVARLAGGPVHARIVGVRTDAFDPHAAHAEVRIGGASIVVAAAARPIRALAQRLLGGPHELDAPRGLTAVEEALWVGVVAAAIEDTGAAAEVWPGEGLPPGASVARVDAAPRSRAGTVVGSAPAARGTAPGTHVALELVVERTGAPWTVVAYVPRSLEVRVPPPRVPRAWTFDLPIVVGRCLLSAGAIARLAVRDVVTVERDLSLVIGAGAVGLTAAQGAVEARVVTGYVPAPMSQPLAETAQLELTVQLGTTRLSLRELGDLSPGAIVPLGRPLAGPFEVRAAGRLIGRGELVDVDGELGVRIVSLEE